MIVTYTGKDLNYPLTAGKLRYIVTGTGRCGTVYIAKLLSSLGYPCGHETIFQCDGMTYNKARMENSTELPTLTVSPIAKLASEDDEKNGFIWYGNNRELVADASYMAAPFIDKECFRGVGVIHTIRNPLKVINSFVVGMKYFQEDNLSEEWEDVTYSVRDYHKFIYKYIPELNKPMHPATRAALYYIKWNQMIETKSENKEYFLHRVEDKLDKLFEFLCVTPIDYYQNRSASHKEDVPIVYKNYSDIPDQAVSHQLQQFASKYGY